MTAYGDVWSWTECIFALWYGYKPLGAREWNVVVWKKMTPKGVALLGGVALLEWVWSYWRKCVTVKADFKVSYAQAMPSISDHFLLPAGWRCSSFCTLSSFSSTTSACMYNDDDGLNLRAVSHPRYMFSFISAACSWCLFPAIGTQTKTQVYRRPLSSPHFTRG